MADIRENTVPAANQMAEKLPIFHVGNENAPKRVLILGNSITWHSPKEDIGWSGDWGMAASAKERDFVHLLYQKLTDAGLDVYMMIHQAASWERGLESEEVLATFYKAAEFGADVMVFRLGENVPKSTDPQVFYQSLLRLIDKIQPREVLFTDCFWRHSVIDPVIRRVAEERGDVCVPLNDLGMDDAMMAIGLFEHRGVSLHPGDRGMEGIAQRIFDELKPMLS